MFTQIKRNEIMYKLISSYESKKRLNYLLYNDDLNTRGTFSSYLNRENLDIKMEYTSARKIVITLNLTHDHK